MDDLVQSARDKLAMKPLSSDQTLLRTAQTSIRLWLAGELTDTQLAEWVHNIVGHTGPDEFQGLVEAHDMFGSLDYIDETEADIHQQIQACAQRAIAQVDPWEQDDSHSVPRKIGNPHDCGLSLQTAPHSSFRLTPMADFAHDDQSPTPQASDATEPTQVLTNPTSAVDTSITDPTIVLSEEMTDIPADLLPAEASEATVELHAESVSSSDKATLDVTGPVEKVAPATARSSRPQRSMRERLDAMKATLPTSLGEPESTAVIRRQNHRLSWIAGTIVALILAIIACAFFVVRANDTADKVVQNYLTAISKGDATTALGYISQPEDATFLTSAVLETSAKITDILVTKKSDTAVEASYTIAGDKFTATYLLARQNGRLQIQNGTAILDLPRTDKIGYAIGATQGQPGHRIIVFPGGYSLTTSDPRLTLTGVDIVKAGEPKTYPVTGNLTITEQGTAQLRTLATDNITACMAKKELAPAGCPWAFATPPGQTLTPGSITWSVAKDPIPAATFTVDPKTFSATSQQLELVLTLTATFAKADGSSYVYEEDNTTKAVADFDLADPQGGLIWRVS
ncbi:MAG: hypothetical protein ACRCWS_05045 [Propionibacteriaceae bacterium]